MLVLLSLFQQLSHHCTPVPTCGLSPVHTHSTVNAIASGKAASNPSFLHPICTTKCTLLGVQCVATHRLFTHCICPLHSTSIVSPRAPRHLPNLQCHKTFLTITLLNMMQNLTPESVHWPVDRLWPSNCIPEVEGVQGLRLLSYVKGTAMSMLSGATTSAMQAFCCYSSALSAAFLRSSSPISHTKIDFMQMSCMGETYHMTHCCPY